MVELCIPGIRNVAAGFVTKFDILSATRCLTLNDFLRIPDVLPIPKPFCFEIGGRPECPIPDPCPPGIPCPIPREYIKIDISVTVLPTVQGWIEQGRSDLQIANGLQGMVDSRLITYTTIITNGPTVVPEGLVISLVVLVFIVGLAIYSAIRGRF